MVAACCEKVHKPCRQAAKTMLKKWKAIRRKRLCSNIGKETNGGKFEKGAAKETRAITASKRADR